MRDALYIEISLYQYLKFFFFQTHCRNVGSSAEYLEDVIKKGDDAVFFAIQVQKKKVVQSPCLPGKGFKELFLCVMMS